MNDQDKTRDQLIAELVELRQRVADESALPELRRAAALLQLAPLGIHECDAEGRIIFVNPSHEAITGYTADELVGTYLWDRMVPGPEKDALPAQLKHLTAKQPVPQPFFAKKIKKSGELFDVRVDWNYIRNSQGEVTGFVTIVTDVTQERNAQAALQESEERYRTLAEATTDAIYILDQAGKLLYANHTAAAYFGVRPGALVGKTQQDLFPPEQVSFHLEHIQKVFETGERQEIEALYRFGRHDVWLNVRTIPLRDEQGRIFSAMGVCRNITEQKRAETALRQAYDELERRVKDRTAELTQANERLQAEVEQGRQAEEELAIFRQFSEASGLGFGMADLDGRISYVNPTLLRWYDETIPENCIGNPLWSYLPIRYQERREQEILPTMLREGYWQGEELLALRDGRTMPAIFSAFPVLDESGDLLRTAVVITDITELKRTEEALRQSEAKYRALVESSPDAVVLLDLQGRIVFASQRATELHGVLHPDALLGSQAMNWVEEKNRHRFRASIGRLIEDKIHRNVEYTLRRDDGTTFDAEVSSAVVQDATGRPEMLMAVYRDITDRKKTEEKIRQSHDELQTIHDGIIEGLLLTEVETKRFIRVNASFCRMLGYTEDELLGASVKDIHPPEEVPNDLRRFQAAAEGRVSINEDRPVLRKDGSIFYADITGHRIIYDERPCLLALFRDVTERKQAEQKLKAEQKALRRMVLAGDYERQLITYELHDGVAQQLMGALMLFQSQEPPEGPQSKATDAYRDGMDALRQASSEVRRLMNRLRTPVLDKFGLAEAIDDVVAQLRLPPEAPEIEYRHNVQFKRLERTLENSLFRIAQEAMTNACRHSKSKKVRVELTQKSDGITLEVRDWGIGFAQHTVAENRFGLEGIRERARILGGHLNINSEIGQGTVVRVTFPVIEATPDE